MIGLKISDAKKLFFDRAAVMSATDRASRKVLSKFGAYVRTRARTSIRPASKANLRKIALVRQQLAEESRPWKRTQLRKELRELYRKQSSQPGSPPKSITGLLKKFIFFVYEPQRRSVVIGPAKLNSPTNAPEILEHGGTAQVGNRQVRIEARPFMRPAFDRELPGVPALWKGAIKP